ncbi:RNA polymerase factor sigma-54 [Testudinibacter sp. TR-2022]|uniref:RNA polymerase factor sigma-54 n=1 Tax=Testudinibacter sp. TR-2022 TaxID=2585029 RepID=UPI001118F170|nr:hypothetical protein [Testudinibacter sp. TR-2022]TNH07241.1 hypothetical protein FHQ30_04630 [Pasteurellaceae bacterium Phil11]TNH21111.1 hypothetical protein FHQ29_10640 [Testudinibacter sp. TR-2022]TNH27794.1 hypothetical protein FHQ27_04505 [Testudinibacter sp. TR-2022]
MSEVSQKQEMSIGLSSDDIMVVNILSFSYDELQYFITDQLLNHAVGDYQKKSYFNFPTAILLEDVEQSHDIFQPPNLHTNLLLQLNELHLNEYEEEVLTFIIDSIDERGFLTTDKQSLYQDWLQYQATFFSAGELSYADFYRYIELVQTLEPLGIGAESVQESILIRLRHSDDCHRLLAERIVQSGWRELGNKNILRQKVKKQFTDISEQDLNAALALIQSISPFPVSCYLEEPIKYRIPEFLLRIEAGEVKIEVLNESDFPFESVLTQSILMQENNPALDRINVIIGGVKYRTLLLRKLLELMTQRQKSFFISKNHSDLAEWDLYEVSRRLNLSLSSLYRLIKDKYIKFDKKIYAFTDLLPTNKYSASSEYIKQRISALLQKNNTLTDQDITDVLTNENIKISRRTVNKYRHQLRLTLGSVDLCL